MKRLLIILAIATELLAFRRWFSCWLFKEGFYYTVSDLLARTIEAINADRGMPILMTKVFHNKLTYFGWGTLQTLLQYVDIRFLTDFIGIAGGFGVYLSIWYFITKDRTNKLLWLTYIVLGIFSLIELFLKPGSYYAVRISLFGLLYIALSLYGIGRFLEKRSMRRYTVIFLVIVLSFLAIFFLPTSFLEYCLKK